MGLPSHILTVVILLLVVLCLAPGCAVKHDPGSVASSGPHRLLLGSLPSEAEGLYLSGGTTALCRGWEELHHGRFSRAEKLLAGAVDRQSLTGQDLAAALCGQGFARLGLSRNREAGEAFTEALAAQPDFSPALLGQSVLFRLEGQPEESVAIYDRLLDRHPRSAMLRREAAAVRSEAVQALIRHGEAAAENDPGAAVAFIRRAIGFDPDRHRPYGVLAGMLESGGQYQEAMESLELAVSLSEGQEARSYRERIAWLELEHGQSKRAVTVFGALLRDTPENLRLQEGLARAEEKFHQASLPEEYRLMLDGVLPLDRGGLAAIIALESEWSKEVPPRSVMKPLVIRDIGSHWAQPYIRAAVDRGVMDLYQNHTFRPTVLVSRGDLAYAACRLLQDGGGELDRAVVIPDVSRDHRHYDCVHRLVSLGVLKRYSDNTVRINAPASGVDAQELISTVGPQIIVPNP